MKTGKMRWFGLSFSIFTVLLIIFTIFSVFYVKGLLNEYEAAQPEKQVNTAIEHLSSEAKDSEAFWTKYQLPQVDDAVKSRFIQLFTNENLTFLPGSSSADDEACYQVKADGISIAEVVLKAKGPAVTKLAVFSMRDWEIKSYRPVLEKKEYTLSLPENFTVSADDKPISADDDQKVSNGKLKYTIKDVYLRPQFLIKDASGKEIAYTVQGTRVIPEIYEYNLTLPSTITVSINGEETQGDSTADGRFKYIIISTEKPEVLISDIYGNQINYQGGSLPLTYHTIDAPQGYTVELDGAKLPDEAISSSIPRKYDVLEGLVENLPSRTRFEIAVLKDGANVTVKDANGNPIELKKGETEHDFTDGIKACDTVPKEISEKVDVLKVAQSWSLFMSNDYSFSDIEKLMVPDSYQYKVAKAYAGSIDRQFFSNHSLLQPAFTENAVKNFCQITDDSFSVEISFVKHMRLTATGKNVDDAMNDRFYFVKQDNKWLLAGLKEVETNE